MIIPWQSRIKVSWLILQKLFARKVVFLSSDSLEWEARTSRIYFYQWRGTRLLGKNEKENTWIAIKSLLFSGDSGAWILRNGAHTLFSSSRWGWGTGRECRSLRQTVHQAESIDHTMIATVNFKRVTIEIRNKNWTSLPTFDLQNSPVNHNVYCLKWLMMSELSA